MTKLCRYCQKPSNDKDRLLTYGDGLICHHPCYTAHIKKYGIHGPAKVEGSYLTKLNKQKFEFTIYLRTDEKCSICGDDEKELIQCKDENDEWVCGRCHYKQTSCDENEKFAQIIVGVADCYSDGKCQHLPLPSAHYFMPYDLSTNDRMVECPSCEKKVPQRFIQWHFGKGKNTGD